MDRLELVKKLASAADVPSSEGEIFFEMFLRKVASERNEDQGLSLAGLGRFAFNKTDNGSSEFIFSPEESSGEMKFMLPVEREIISYPKFSSSIGKPVFPFGRRTENFSFVMHPHENLHSLETRADMLILSLSETEKEIQTEQLLQIPERDTDILIEDNIFKDLTDSLDEEKRSDFIWNEETLAEENNLDLTDTAEANEETVEDDFGQVTAEDFLDNAFNDDGFAETEEQVIPEIPAKEEDIEEKAVHPEEDALTGLRSVLDKILSSESIEELDEIRRVNINGDTEKFNFDELEEVKEPEAVNITDEDEILFSELTEDEDTSLTDYSFPLTGDVDKAELSVFDEIEGNIEDSSDVDLSDFIDNSESENKILEEENKEATFGQLAEHLIDEKYDDEETEEKSFEKTFGKLMTSADQEQEAKHITLEETPPDSSFQRVKSLTREFYNLSSIEQNDSLPGWDFGDNEKIEDTIKKITRAFDEPEPAVGDGKDGFRAVRSKKATYEWSPEELPLPKKTIAEMNEEPDETEIDLKLEEIPVHEKPITSTIKVTAREQTKNRNFVIIVIILGIILLTLWGYYKLSSLNSPSTLNDIKKSPVVIERNDKVPVMIPGRIEQSSAEQNDDIKQPEEQPQEQRISSEPVKVSDGIYTVNNMYYIQVSSWQTKSKVNAESEKYINKGYKTSIMTSELRSGTWYRLLVGEFESASAAEIFLTSNL